MGALSVTILDGRRVFVMRRDEIGWIRGILVNEPGKRPDVRLIPEFPPSFTVEEVRKGDTRLLIDHGNSTLEVGAIPFLYKGHRQIRLYLRGDFSWEFTRDDAKARPTSFVPGLKSRLPSGRRGSPRGERP